MKKLYRHLTSGITTKKVLIIIIGAVICSFGIHNIHQRTGITEGGILGAMLLIEHWLNISPAYITPILDIACYLMAVWEAFPFMLPDFTDKPLIAALLGGCFVGIGVGLIIRQGGSSGGDDALALTISNATKWKLSKCYLFTDITVLLLSLSYIPVTRIIFSLVTVTISSFLIDFINTFELPQKEEEIS